MERCPRRCVRRSLAWCRPSGFRTPCFGQKGLHTLSRRRRNIRFRDNSKMKMKESRREFLVKSSCALSMTALATQFRHFGLMSALASETEAAVSAAPPSDYRALVCIFMLGGNDGNNSVIPLHSDANVSGYPQYYAARNPYELALAQNTLLPF